MSDTGNSFGEALENMTTNTKKAIGGTIADFTKTATGQVKGSGGTTQSPQSGSFNPNTLSGGDLFSPDMFGKKQTASQQASSQQANQVTPNTDQKSPEDLQKIQNIQAELAQMKQRMHSDYYQDFLRKAEGKDKKQQLVKEEEEKQQDEVKKMEDLQQKRQRDQDVAKFRAARGTELAKGNQG